MYERLRHYIDELFAQAPQTAKTVELKEEIYQNLCDKYHDLLREGKSEEAAYNIAVASVGDISELIDQLKVSRTNDPDVQAQMEKRRVRSAACISIAVALYILSVVPVILWEDYGVVAMFVMIAAATALLIFNSMTKPRYQKTDDTVVEEFKQWQDQSRNAGSRQLLKALSGALWALIVAAYFLISFATGAWSITWVIFLIGAAVEGIVKAIFDLVQK